MVVEDGKGVRQEMTLVILYIILHIKIIHIKSNYLKKKFYGRLLYGPLFPGDSSVCQENKKATSTEAGKGRTIVPTFSNSFCLLKKTPKRDSRTTPNMSK